MASLGPPWTAYLGLLPLRWTGLIIYLHIYLVQD